MSEFFPEIQAIKYEGPDSRNPLAFKHYNPKLNVLGKPMAEHLRFSIAYWHTFKGTGSDPFGPGTILRDYNNSSDPMTVAEDTLPLIEISSESDCQSRVVGNARERTLDVPGNRIVA